MVGVKNEDLNVCLNDSNVGLTGLAKLIDSKYDLPKSRKILFIDTKYSCMGNKGGIFWVTKPTEASFTAIFDMRFNSIEHEFGHAMGLEHAASLWCDEYIKKLKCNTDNYSNYESKMGGEF